MNLIQTINNLVLNITIPEWADISDIVIEAQDFLIEEIVNTLIDKYPQDLELLEQINQYIEEDVNLQMYEDLMNKKLSSEEIIAWKNESLQNLQEYFTEQL